MFYFWKQFKNALRPEINRSDLLTILRGLAQENLLRSRIDALKELMEWMRLPVKIVTEDESPDSAFHSRNVRFKFLMQFLERNPEEAKHLLATIHEFTCRGMAIRLFSLTGVSENNHFMAELKERLSQRFLPLVHNEYDLAELFEKVFTDPEDALWIERCHKLLFPPIVTLMETHKIDPGSLYADMEDALILLTSQISSIGTGREIRRCQLTNLGSSPFIRLGQILYNHPDDHTPMLNEISACRLYLADVQKSLETSGVSVDLIYLMEKLESLINRLELLIQIRHEADPEIREKLQSLLLARLIRAEIKRAGIIEFLHENLQLITMKVVEHAGTKGDFYIAQTSSEKKKLLNAGAWAGVLTAFAALFKVLIGQISAPYLIEGILYFFNYALIFLLMQRWHLALSSKLPAYTASALARKFQDFLHTHEVSEIVSEIKKISHSQFLAALSNLIWVAPVCVGIDYFLLYTTKTHLLSPAEAHSILNKHNLLTSGTLFYAFITGIFLWSSSLMTGAVENWLVYRNFPTFIKESPFMNRLLPKTRIVALADGLPSLLGGVAGNLCIAALLAFPVVLGKITGLPLDIRHVTLSAGSITFAFNALGWDYVLWPSMISMACSIMVMGVLNFGVSFYCSFKLAAIARNIDDRYITLIFKYTFFKKKRKPTLS